MLEPNIISPVTLSIGQVFLNGRFYSYHGQQQSTVGIDGCQTYGGTTLTMVRGKFDDLSKVVNDAHTRKAVDQARVVYSAYSLYNPIISRANFDVVQGYGNGDFLSGVVDQSIRIGGATPAEILAIETLNRDPSAQQVTAEVTVRWNPQSNNNGSTDEVIFFEHPLKRDAARIVRVDQ